MVRGMRKLRIAAVVSLLALLSAVAVRASIPPSPPAYSIEAWRLAHPIDAPYWSPAFVLESRNVYNDLTTHGYWKTHDYQGVAYHFKNGQRLVVGAPANAPHTLWLFGNSGLFDPWLPDNLTAASDLQAMLGPTWRVVDQAASGQAVLGQYSWLKDTPIKAGDMVVFVDGALDGTSILNSNDANGDIERYNATITKARVYSVAHGAGFWHFLQPYIDEGRYTAIYSRMYGIRLDVPPQDFIESAHMNERGAALEAREVYDWLTVY